MYFGARPPEYYRTGVNVKVRLEVTPALPLACSFAEYETSSMPVVLFLSVPNECSFGKADNKSGLETDRPSRHGSTGRQLHGTCFGAPDPSRAHIGPGHN